MNSSIEKDIQIIQSIDAVPYIMNMLSEATGLRFICIARVTDKKWTTCAVHDLVNFNINPGDELEISTTFCSQVRKSTQPIVIEHAQNDAIYSKSEIPIMYGFESYFSFPIYSQDGNFFGTLCGLDPLPAKLKTIEIEHQIKSFAELISRQIEVNQKLSNAESNLFDEQTAAKLREQYIAILGHDLRTPLSALTMGISFLIEQIKDDTSQKILARMDNSATRMKRLISDVMDLTHGKMGNGIELNVKTVNNLQDILAHTISELTDLHPQRTIRTDIKMVGSVECDPERISQLLSNLLINAIVHGDPTQIIEVKSIIENGIFSLSVSNGGAPINPETIDKLFQPFWRNESNKQTGGLGLGLFIASQITSAHNGTLAVSSNKSRTVFTFQATL
ncbi:MULTISPECIES: GAF domain-containing sensor histidine kinase [Aliiglaciecola]|uniref:GAF domain-containing sensor histidine kinase n=1 Tax=Aliiglaciecola TaxID=1406885 RepID=UPI001C087DB0|nr:MULTISPECIES: HAMP domain-containing sensor histidine kinase [Aliiglaciecola]MBU2879267.1 HAMP domain-containing histidine kinase [Aliiglaciecola lipolytica]MDO6709719.1 HAMP domain-containing sensor histidine kinase [Aliiglaciecola sp. 2_MG-2023]MDO6750739.1 HAMP domain-containing sensor histidine kinase [Aliiglaciecola sp. 1_MG-2023]